MQYKKIAILGSNGFIGRNLSRFILNDVTAEVILLGTGPACCLGNGYNYRQFNLLDPELEYDSVFADVDLVYYLSSVSIPSSTWETPEKEVEQNLLPFIRFMNAVCRLSLKKLVFISSAGTVYGATYNNVVEDSYKNPFNPHGITKLTMEYFLNYYQIKYGINFDIYRVANVYGEGQSTSKGIGIINSFLESIIKSGTVNIFGDGSNIRNYVYVQDLAFILSRSVYLPKDVSEVFNVASNDTLSINELVTIIKKVVDRPFEILYTPKRLSDNPSAQLDNTKLLNTFSEFNFTSIEEGIRKTYNFISHSIGLQKPGL